ncbi:MAG: hypothetical protein AB7F40_05635 [Victivallaceae bacterium]
MNKLVEIGERVARIETDVSYIKQAIEKSEEHEKRLVTLESDKKSWATVLLVGVFLVNLGISIAALLK